MRNVLCFMLTFGALSAIPSLSYADGCIKGAVAGAAIGHLKHHAVVGAVGGCIVGHHLAAKEKKTPGNG